MLLLTKSVHKTRSQNPYTKFGLTGTNQGDAKTKNRLILAYNAQDAEFSPRAAAKKLEAEELRAMISDTDKAANEKSLNEKGGAERLLSVKEAAALLNLDKKSVRERLLNGQLTGEKKLVGDREKWFVDSYSVEKTLARRKIDYADQAESAVQILKVITATAVDADSANNLDQAVSLNQEGSAPIRHSASEVLRGEWYQQEKARIEDFIEHAVSEQVLQPLVDRLSAEANKQIAAATKAANDELEVERLKAIRLEERVFELHEAKVELEVSLHQEIELLQLESDSRENLVMEQLKTLTQKLEKLERPWWKKLFSK